MKAATALIFSLPAMANSNDQISDWHVPKTGHGHPLEMGLFVPCTVLQPPPPSQPGRKEEKGKRKTKEKLALLEKEEEVEGGRERPSLKGSVLASQPSHHFNALSCSDVSLCMVLPRPLFPLSTMFLASSQLNAH